MEFKFEPERITKDLLLNYRSEEDFFRMYLGFTPQKGKSYKNPLRDDKHSGCSFLEQKTDCILEISLEIKITHL